MSASTSGERRKERDREIWVTLFDGRARRECVANSRRRWKKCTRGNLTRERGECARFDVYSEGMDFEPVFPRGFIRINPFN